MWLTLTALSTALAGLAAAGLYLHTGQDAWPPPEVTAPGGGRALAALALAAVGAGLAHAARLRLRAGAEEVATSLLFGAMVASSGTVLVLANDLAAAGFRWDVHAYTSVYWVMTVTAACFAAVGVLMLAAVGVQRLTGVVDPARMLELEVAAGYVWWSVAAIAVCLAVVHLLPDPAAAPAALGVRS
jgi:heme/copper-type cytochrome/quinol oxidase subunit 3